MKTSAWLKVLLALAVIAGAGACKPFPTKPLYHSPVISWATAFPTTVGQGDSLLVTIVASDPDGDSLVYDWIARGYLRVKDAPGGAYLYNSANPTQVFYRLPGPLNDSITFVDCFVRDHTGGGAGVRVFIRLRD